MDGERDERFIAGGRKKIETSSTLVSIQPKSLSRRRMLSSRISNP
jgi:hypothetical protein